MKKLKLPNIKGIFKVKNKLRASLIGTLMLITVGYAGLNSTLGVEGLISILQNADFNVFFSKTIVDGIEKLSLIDPSGQSITFTSSDISTVNDSVVDYTIMNGSSQYNAEVSISCSPEINDGIKLEYGKDKTLIEANSSFSGSITSKIVDGETTSTDRLERLIDIIRKQSKGSDVTNNIDYNKISSNTNGNGVYTTNNTDSGKNVYFFRGNVNNNVVFADKCWKMIRTTETDGVKLIYNGDYVNGKCGQGSPIIENTTFNYNIIPNDNTYVGYMYGTADSLTYEETHKNINDSDLKKVIDKWYEDNLFNTTYENYIEDTPYCNDRSVITDFSNLSLSSNSYTPNGYAKEMTLYGYGARGGRNVKQITPTLKCKNMNDRFTKNVENGNGALKYPVAAITADEIIYAGAKGGAKTEEMGTAEQNMNFYLYSSTISWTMTPVEATPKSVISLLYLGGINSATEANAFHGGVRPVLSVKGDTRVRV